MIANLRPEVRGMVRVGFEPGAGIVLVVGRETSIEPPAIGPATRMRSRMVSI